MYMFTYNFVILSKDFCMDLNLPLFTLLYSNLLFI